MQPILSQLEHSFNPSPIVQINDERLRRHGVELWLKRDDLLHPVISGNKWRKLKYIVDHALALGCNTLISMGGAYSNHLHALAYVGNLLGLRTIGYIRGERTDLLTPTLRDMLAWGMRLEFVSRSDYRVLRNYKGWRDLPGIGPGQYWLPEGGAQALALTGVAEMIGEIDKPYQHLCLACGTGATLAGTLTTVPKQVSVTGFAVFKNAGFLVEDVSQLIGASNASWRINLDYHFGGFAQTTPELLAFIEHFQSQTQVPIEPVYTGKMLYGLFDLLAKGYFQPGQSIIAVHTGGLQGSRGFLNP